MARDFSPVFSGADEKTRDYAVVWAAAPEGLAVVGLGRVERAVVGLDRADRVVVGLGRADRVVVGLDPADRVVVGLDRADRVVVGLGRADRAVVGLVRVGKAEGWDVQEDEGCMNCRYRRAASIGNGKFDRT